MKGLPAFDTSCFSEDEIDGIAPLICKRSCCVSILSQLGGAGVPLEEGENDQVPDKDSISPDSPSLFHKSTPLRSERETPLRSERE
jgi:hypothetical protein